MFILHTIFNLKYIDIHIDCISELKCSLVETHLDQARVQHV